jgi:hypothetical protein
MDIFAGAHAPCGKFSAVGTYEAIAVCSFDVICVLHDSFDSYGISVDILEREHRDIARQGHHYEKVC